MEDFSDSDDSNECSSVPSDEDYSLLDSEISDDEESLLTSGGNTDSEDSLYKYPVVQIAQPPEVLEPSIPIEKYPGVPCLMRHKEYRICGDNLDKNVYTRHMHMEEGSPCIIFICMQLG